MKIVIAVNTAWNLYNFRAGLIRSFVAAGYDVIAVAPHDQYVSRLSKLGCRYVELPMDGRGLNPIRDGVLFLRFMKILYKEKPDLFLGYTIKPNVYGSIAAHLLNVKTINNIAGLGFAFVKKTWLTHLATILYRLALSNSSKVFFQNNDDRNMFIEKKIVRSEVADTLPGSGIDLMHFSIDAISARDHK